MGSSIETPPDDDDVVEYTGTNEFAPEGTSSKRRFLEEVISTYLDLPRVDLSLPVTR